MCGSESYNHDKVNFRTFNLCIESNKSQGRRVCYKLKYNCEAAIN